MVELRRTVFGWKRSSLAEPRASRGTHRANPASGPKPHKPYPQGPLKIRACVLEPNPDPKQVHTGLARGQVLLLPSLIMTEEKRGWRMDEAYITLVLGVDLHPPSKAH